MYHNVALNMSVLVSEDWRRRWRHAVVNDKLHWTGFHDRHLRHTIAVGSEAGNIRLRHRLQPVTSLDLAASEGLTTEQDPQAQFLSGLDRQRIGQRNDFQFVPEHL
jgi:hypothetical protein